MPKAPKLQYEIKTKRLLLRPLTVDDVDTLWPHVTDKELPKWMTWEAYTKKRDARETYAMFEKDMQAGTQVMWGIFEQDTFCGVVSLDDISRKQFDVRMDTANLGYWLTRAARGQGIMTEAATAALQFGFKQLGLHKIITGCFDKNIASQKVIERLGFRTVGIHRKHFFKRGRWHDNIVYELLKEDFRPSKIHTNRHPRAAEDQTARTSDARQASMTRRAQRS